MVAIPIYVRHNISLKPGSTGRIELTVGPKQSMGKVVSFIVLALLRNVGKSLICGACFSVTFINSLKFLVVILPYLFDNILMEDAREKC